MKIFCENYETKGTTEHAFFLWTTAMLFSALGMHELNLRCWQQALEIYESAGGVYKDVVENLKGSVSIALSGLGRYSEATTMQEEILQRGIKKYGIKFFCPAVILKNKLT